FTLYPRLLGQGTDPGRLLATAKDRSGQLSRVILQSYAAARQAMLLAVIPFQPDRRRRRLRVQALGYAPRAGPRPSGRQAFSGRRRSVGAQGSNPAASPQSVLRRK